MAVAPIKPADVVEKKSVVIPDVVMDTFNDLIARNFADGEARFEQEEVVKALVAKGHTREEIFANHWLDVEDIYRKAGWNVEYDKPGAPETYRASFTFRQRAYRR